MTYSESLTQTYSVVDIGKVIDCIAADFDMNAQSTGLLTREKVKRYSVDIKTMAQKGYLLEANIILNDSFGRTIRAAKYEVSIDASTLTAQRPGNNLWPCTPGGELSVIVQWNQKWWDLTPSQRVAFMQGLSPDWTTSNVDLSFPSLSRTTDRNYLSSGWGVIKSVYA